MTSLIASFTLWNKVFSINIFQLLSYVLLYCFPNRCLGTKIPYFSPKPFLWTLLLVVQKKPDPPPPPDWVMCSKPLSHPYFPPSVFTYTFSKSTSYVCMESIYTFLLYNIAPPPLLCHLSMPIFQSRKFSTDLCDTNLVMILVVD